MKKPISVKDLIAHVSKVDYADSNTFPVVFDVINGDRIVKYEAGICPTAVDGECTESQYFIQTDDIDQIKEFIKTQFILLNYDVIDIADPDNMLFEDIEAMIYNCCDITTDSIVRIHEDESFTGDVKDVLVIHTVDENGEVYLDDKRDIKKYNWIDWQINNKL